ncbi:unnamed protein product [Schistocephalus solidus]|uniref:Protein kinase domain-containing protein n=2 Tax=Schistocephalus solidus TaxID=70667 RepID=A0A183SP85_SCHSO|nr:unnamed protein product [Schistocephalus solidus]
MIDQNFLDVTSATPPLPSNHVDATTKFRNDLPLQTDHGMPLSLMSYNREDTPKTPLDSSLLLGSTKTQNNVDSLFAPSPSNHDFLDIELPVDPSSVQEIKDLGFNEPRCETTIHPSSGLVTPPDTRVVCNSNGSNIGGHDSLTRQGLPDNTPDIIASRLVASHSIHDDVDGITVDHLKVIKGGCISDTISSGVLSDLPYGAGQIPIRPAISTPGLSKNGRPEFTCLQQPRLAYEYNTDVSSLRTQKVQLSDTKCLQEPAAEDIKSLIAPPFTSDKLDNPEDTICHGSASRLETKKLTDAADSRGLIGVPSNNSINVVRVFPISTTNMSVSDRSSITQTNSESRLLRSSDLRELSDTVVKCSPQFPDSEGYPSPHTQPPNESSLVTGTNNASCPQSGFPSVDEHHVPPTESTSDHSCSPSTSSPSTSLSLGHTASYTALKPESLQPPIKVQSTQNFVSTPGNVPRDLKTEVSSESSPPVVPAKPTTESNSNQVEIYDDAEYAAAAVAAVDSVVSALAGNKAPTSSGALDPALTGTGTDRLYSLSLAPGPSLVNCNSRVCRNSGDAADPCCNVSNNFSSPSSKCVLRCDACDHLLPTPLPLPQHQEYITCPNCHKAVPVKMLVKQRMIPEEAKHVCDNCKRSFVREDKLKRHIMSIHTMEKPHICHICTKAFSRKDKLKDHLKHHERAARNFECTQCQFAFVQKSDLNRHIRGVHQGEPGVGINMTVRRKVPGTSPVRPSKKRRSQDCNVTRPSTTTVAVGNSTVTTTVASSSSQDLALRFFGVPTATEALLKASFAVSWSKNSSAVGSSTTTTASTKTTATTPTALTTTTTTATTTASQAFAAAAAAAAAAGFAQQQHLHQQAAMAAAHPILAAAAASSMMLPSFPAFPATDTPSRRQSFTDTAAPATARHETEGSAAAAIEQQSDVSTQTSNATTTPTTNTSMMVLTRVAAAAAAAAAAGGQSNPAAIMAGGDCQLVIGGHHEISFIIIHPRNVHCWCVDQAARVVWQSDKSVTQQTEKALRRGGGNRLGLRRRGGGGGGRRIIVSLYCRRHRCDTPHQKCTRSLTVAISTPYRREIAVPLPALSSMGFVLRGVRAHCVDRQQHQVTYQYQQQQLLEQQRDRAGYVGSGSPQNQTTAVATSAAAAAAAAAAATLQQRQQQQEQQYLAAVSRQAHEQASQSTTSVPQQPTAAAPTAHYHFTQQPQQQAAATAGFLFPAAAAAAAAAAAPSAAAAAAAAASVTPAFFCHPDGMAGLILSSPYPTTQLALAAAQAQMQAAHAHASAFSQPSCGLSDLQVVANVFAGQQQQQQQPHQQHPQLTAHQQHFYDTSYQHQQSLHHQHQLFLQQQQQQHQPQLASVHNAAAAAAAAATGPAAAVMMSGTGGSQQLKPTNSSQVVLQDAASNYQLAALYQQQQQQQHQAQQQQQQGLVLAYHHQQQLAAAAAAAHQGRQQQQGR